MEVPTIEIDVDGHPVVINASEFDETTMKRWETPEQKAAREASEREAAAPAAPASLPLGGMKPPDPVPPPSDPGEDTAESARRRPSRG